MRNLIAEIALHRIVLLSTHVVQDVEYAAKELILLSDGAVLRQASAQTLLREMQGQVWEVPARGEAEIAHLRTLGQFCGIVPSGEGLFVRLLAPAQPTPGQPPRPSGAGGRLSRVLRGRGAAMRGELRKVLCTRWSAALLAALVALNGVLFYRYCTQPQGDEDYTLPQLRAAYARSDAELQADYDAQWARLDAAEPLTDEVYDEIYLAMSLDEAVLTQRETVRSYPDYVRSLREEAEAKQRSGFFGAPDSFAGRSLRRAAAHYAHLEVLAPEPSFSGGITVLTDWRVTDGICAAGGAMAGLLLLTGEQAAGLLCLVRPDEKRPRRALSP